jgi:hypothetical protein
MTFSAKSRARPAVKFWIVAYANNVGFGLSEFIDAVLIIALPGFMCGTPALVR